MRYFRSVLLSVFVLTTPLALYAQATASSIDKELRGLRSVPDAQRPAETVRIAKEIRTLPVGAWKLRLADGLCQMAEEGDSGHAAMQVAADTLAQTLTEVPLPEAGDSPAIQYFDLARLVRYEGVTTNLRNPQFTKANAMLAASDADVEKADFTLYDRKGKKYTLSALRGKVVLVSFWATWCPPCLQELPDLDAIYMRFQSQGLIVLSITMDTPSTLNRFFSRGTYRPPVLLDTDGTVTQKFHAEDLPVTYVFSRTGKLAAKSIDTRNYHQLMQMLAKAGLHS